MNGFQVITTTIAGSGRSESMDGVGVAASLAQPIGLAYSHASGTLWISEDDTDRIRAIQPASARWNEELKRAVTVTLFQSHAIPIQPLLSIVLDFALGDSTCVLFRHNRVSTHLCVL